MLSMPFLMTWLRTRTAHRIAAGAVALAALPLHAHAAEGAVAGPYKLLAEIENPYGMEYLPDGRLLITDKPGRLFIWDGRALSAPVTGVPKVGYRAQGGLLDVAVDPGFAQNRTVYLSFTEEAAAQPGGRDVPDARLGPYQEIDDAVVKGLAVARAQLVDGTLRGVTVIWRAEKTLGRQHFAGRLAFHPDGTLFITSGDRQRFEPAQDLGSALGKVLRIRTDGSIPADNPFAAGPAAHRAVWSFGHRNPLGIVVGARGEVWINEMGPMHGDELLRAPAGSNHGWPVVSEGDHYDGKPMKRSSSTDRYSRPLFAWWPAISPSGMLLYTGGVHPQWSGKFVIGGLGSKGLIAVGLDGAGHARTEALYMGRRVRDLIQSPAGDLLVLFDGRDERGGLAVLDRPAP